MEMLERDKTLEALKEGNQELENILASLRVLKTVAITLGRPVHLIFKDVISEIIIILIPQNLTLFDLELVPPSPAIGSFYKIKMSLLSRKGKRSEEPTTISPRGGGGDHAGH